MPLRQPGGAGGEQDRQEGKARRLRPHQRHEAAHAPSDERHHEVREAPPECGAEAVEDAAGQHVGYGIGGAGEGDGTVRAPGTEAAPARSNGTATSSSFPAAASVGHETSTARPVPAPAV